MLMSVVVRDSVKCMGSMSQATFDKCMLDIVLYADDTLLIGSSGADVQEFLRAVKKSGKRFGLALQYSKFQLLEANGNYVIE